MTTTDEFAGGVVTVGWLNDWTLRTVWSGHGTGGLVARAHVRVSEELRRRPARYLLCETDAVTGYDASIRMPAKRLINEARARGVGEMIVVAASQTRMLAFALGMLARTRTRVFPTWEAAAAYCAKYADQGRALDSEAHPQVRR